MECRRRSKTSKEKRDNIILRNFLDRYEYRRLRRQRENIIEVTPETDIVR